MSMVRKVILKLSLLTWLTTILCLVCLLYTSSMEFNGFIQWLGHEILLYCCSLHYTIIKRRSKPSFLLIFAYIKPATCAKTPITKRAMMIVIGDTFFLSNHIQAKVRSNPIKPGINESKFCWKVVTFSGVWDRPEPTWAKASWIPLYPSGSLSPVSYTHLDVYKRQS